MKDTKDIVTPELPGVPAPKARSQKKHATKAAKQAAYRAAHGLRLTTIQLPNDVAERLDAYLAAKGKTKEKSAVIAKLIETQLLRKR